MLLTQDRGRQAKRASCHFSRLFFLLNLDVWAPKLLKGSARQKTGRFAYKENSGPVNHCAKLQFHRSNDEG